MNKSSIQLDNFLVSATYSFTDGFGLRIVKMEKHWVVSDSNIGGLWPYQRMDGKKLGNAFKTFPDAQEAVRKIVEYVKEPLTRREIRHWFNERWVRKEEQSKMIREFKFALLYSNWKRAAQIYNKQLSGHSKEAIPFKVHYQVCKNLNPEKHYAK